MVDKIGVVDISGNGHTIGRPAKKKVLSESFTATGTSGAIYVKGKRPVSLTGLTAGDGSVTLERSNDGIVYTATAMPDMSNAAFTDDAQFSIEESLSEGAWYRFNCTARSSGTFVCLIGSGTK